MRHKNSYDFIRFIAASMVVFSHSFALVGITEPKIGNISLGTLGVWIFFILSGYLISHSWHQYPRFNVFFAKRALRIFPALIVAVLVSVIVSGIFFTNLSLVEFFKSPETLSYLNNILLINPQYSLPGEVFATNPHPNAVNGSIWTLAYEFLMYATVAVFGVLGIFKKIGVTKIWIVLFVSQIIMSILGVQNFDFVILYFQFNFIVTLALMFFTGVLVQQHYNRFAFAPKYGIIAATAFLAFATLIPIASELVAATILAYAVFSLGNSSKMSWFGKYGDFSYGIYIYSFPIQQMIVSITSTTQPFKLFGLSLAISIIAGALSWWLVESRVLKFKSKINLKKYPLLQADTA